MNLKLFAQKSPPKLTIIEKKSSTYLRQFNETTSIIVLTKRITRDEVEIMN